MTSTNTSTVPVEHVVAATADHSLKSRVRDALLPFYKPTRSRIYPGIARSIAMSPVLFEIWYRARALRHLMTHGVQSYDAHELVEQPRFLDKVASYNKSQLWTWHRTRTEKLMVALRCIDSLPRNPRVLVIGPRNEAELLLLHLYGFSLSRIRAIDIFSYSPAITLMDMHNLSFEDNSFDVVYSAWTLRYSYDIKKACSELVRVTKPGGVIATGFSNSKVQTDVTGARLDGGLRELLALFEPHVDWIYWQEEFATTTTNDEVTTIFRVRK